MKKGILRNFTKFTGKHLCHMFSSEFCGISKNTFVTEHLWTTASDTSITNFSDGKASSSTTLNSATLKRLFKRPEKNERDLKEKEEKKKRKEWKKFNVSFSFLI